MNIDASNVNKVNEKQTVQKNNSEKTDSTINFADELKELEIQEATDKEQVAEENTEELKPVNADEINPEQELNYNDKLNSNNKELNNTNSIKVLDSEKDKNNFKNINKTNPIETALEDLSSVVKKINQSDDIEGAQIKDNENLSDNNDMINNDFNIQENKDLLPQMNTNMNFSGDGQPFSSFMNNEEQSNKKDILPSTAKDIAEENEILSTMSENIAIANKNMALPPENKEAPKPEKIKPSNPFESLNAIKPITEEVKPEQEVKVVNRNDGIKKVDTNTGITIENVIKYDSVIMNQADVEVFVNLVENNTVDMNNLAPKAAERGVQVSKTLADMLAKSMENNQPVRIDFDNDISIIIKISRDGKISADFLPSSQVAEAYLRENLPLLRQRFENNNIDYESLEQRERRNQDKEQNRKKGRENE